MISGQQSVWTRLRVKEPLEPSAPIHVPSAQITKRRGLWYSSQSLQGVNALVLGDRHPVLGVRLVCIESVEGRDCQALSKRPEVSGLEYITKTETQGKIDYHREYLMDDGGYR